MSITRDQLVNTLSPPLPKVLIEKLIEEYQSLKKQFFLGHYKPSELDAARFSECVLRIIEYEDISTYTPLGIQIDSQRIIRHAENNVNLPESIRIFIPKLCRILLDIRNRRDVAHVGVGVSPNFSDSQLVCQCADWILIELIRAYCSTSIDKAREIVKSINDMRVPVIAEVNGFVRVQDTTLKASEQTLVILYHRHPESVTDSDLIKWIEYKNSARYKKEILGELHKQALIHYQNGKCSLLPKGEKFVEKNIQLELLT